MAQAFSETDRGISQVVVAASLIMALVLLVLGCVTACIARVVANGIVEPVNQLIDVVHALNKLDFSRQVHKRSSSSPPFSLIFFVDVSTNVADVLFFLFARYASLSRKKMKFYSRRGDPRNTRGSRVDGLCTSSLCAETFSSTLNHVAGLGGSFI